MTQGSQVRESCPAFCFTSILADHLRESRTALPWLPPRSVAWPCSGIGFGLTTHDPTYSLAVYVLTIHIHTYENDTQYRR